MIRCKDNSRVTEEYRTSSLYLNVTEDSAYPLLAVSNTISLAPGELAAVVQWYAVAVLVAVVLWGGIVLLTI